MNTPLPHWIERLLGFETEAGEGMVWRLAHRWGWPPWATVLLLVGLAGFVAWNYVRENPAASRRLRVALAAIRLTLIVVLLAMLAQFSLLLNRTGLPYLAVVLDDSLSMSVRDSYDASLRQSLEERLEELTASSESDESESPPERVEDDGISRWDLARLLLLEDQGRHLKRIARDYDLRLYYLTGMERAREQRAEILARELVEREPTGSSSRLGEGLRRVLEDLRGTAPAAVVLMSDGVNTEGPGLAKAAASAQRRGVPLFTVTLGNQSRARDVELRDLLVDDTVFVNDLLQFQCLVSATGYEGQAATIRLREESESAVLAESVVALPADGTSLPVRLLHQAEQEGEFHYRVEIVPQVDELRVENNVRQHTVRVRDEKIRVLMVQGVPTFEYRFLKNMLSRDESIELDTVLQDADFEHAQQDATARTGFPVQREELFDYDLVILSDADPSRMTPSMMRNLVDFVQSTEGGGALICIAGPLFMPLAYRDTPLETLLPVRLENARLPDPREYLTEPFTLVPTDLGWNSPSFMLGETPERTRAIWDSLPPMYWMAETPDVRPGARVLARHSHRRDVEGMGVPLIVQQYVGGGQVLLHNVDATWRWRKGVGDSILARYWIQAMRQMCRAKLASGDEVAVLSTDRPRLPLGEEVTLRLQFADSRRAPSGDTPITVVLQCAGQRNRKVQLARAELASPVFEARLSDLNVGDYHGWVAVPTLGDSAPTVDFRVVEPPGELERVVADEGRMRQAAESAGGRAYTVADASRLWDDLPPGRHVPVEALPPIPLWNRWPVLFLFLTLLVAEWILRKRGRML